MNKKIVKTIAVTATLSTMLVGLTGCNININVGNNNKSNSVATEVQKPEENKVAKITHEYKHLEDTKHYLIVKGLDKDGNEVWTYETDRDYVPQWETIEYFDEHDGIIYLNELGTIVALSKETGKIIWKNAEYRGSGSQFTFDKDGYLYLAGYVSPRLFVVSPDGKTVAKIAYGEELDELSWVENIKITDDNLLQIEYPAREIDEPEVYNRIIVDIRDIKNTDNKILARETKPENNGSEIYGFESIEKFELSEDGVVTAIFKSDSDLAKKYENGKTEIAKNVKSITPLFWGNGGYGTLAMVKLDGTVAFLDSMAVHTGDLAPRKSDKSNILYSLQIETIGGAGIGLVDKYGELAQDLI